MSITYKAKLFGRRILPPVIINVLKKVEKQFIKIRGFYYKHKNFNHTNAQIFEFNFGVNWMKKGHFAKAYTYWEQAKKEGICSPAAFERITFHTDPHFFQDKGEFDDFCRKTDGKKCLEIGSATEGILALMPWLNKRIIIDPLIIKYRDAQLNEWGKTIFTDDIKLYDQFAEVVIPELVGKIDGSIVCRNTLDHASDPWKILENMGIYAAEGCTLLLWTDIWHLKPLDAGHRNIIEDPVVFEDKIKELGFDIVRKLPDIGDHRPTIHYGCVAIKRAA